MNLSFSTYEVKKGDTLASVADKLGISAEALKRYHNTYCELNELIGHDIGGQPILLIPPKEQVIELKAKKENEEERSHLPSTYLTASFYAPNYLVTETFEDLNDTNYIINYEVELKILKTADKGFVVDVATNNFTKENKRIDTKFSSLSMACLESISPLRFNLPVQGKIKGFYNHKELIQQFESKKSEIENYFIGKVSENYIKEFEKGLRNEKQLSEKFSNGLLYQVLFPKLEWFRKQNSWEELFYILPNMPAVNCRFEITHEIDDTDDVKTNIKGKVIDKKGVYNLLKKARLSKIHQKEIITIELSIDYTTNKTSKELLKIDTEILFHTKQKAYKRMHLTTIKRKNNE